MKANNITSDYHKPMSNPKVLIGSG